jgi:hypothetical protein
LQFFILIKIAIVHKEETAALITYLPQLSTNLLTFSSLSKNEPNSSESTSGMDPADVGAAATGAASTAGAELKADLIL